MSPFGSIITAGMPSIAASSIREIHKPVFPLPVIPMHTACVTKSLESYSSKSSNRDFRKVVETTQIENPEFIKILHMGPSFKADSKYLLGRMYFCVCATNVIRRKEDREANVLVLNMERHQQSPKGTNLNKSLFMNIAYDETVHFTSFLARSMENSQVSIAGCFNSGSHTNYSRSFDGSMACRFRCNQLLCALHE